MAFRNFLRQRRRNLLLGSAIAFGIMVLTVSFAFTEGLTDTILNRIVIYMSGHVQVNVVEQGRFMSPVIRDKARFLDAIHKNVDGIMRVEESTGTLARAVGNGKGDYVYLVGLEINQKFTESFVLNTGSYNDFIHPSYPNPVLLSEQKAKGLKVKVGDAIHLRFQNIYGQSNTATLVVAAIMKSQNVWMDWAIFMPQNDFKAIMGYRPHETGALRVLLKKPKLAPAQADHLWQALKPQPAYIAANLVGTSVAVAPFALEASTNHVLKHFPVSDAHWSPESKGCLLSSLLAARLQKHPGDLLTLSYQAKFQTEPALFTLPVAAVVDFPPTLSGDLIFMNNEDFFKVYNYQLPANTAPLKQWLPASSGEIARLVAPEWTLLERTHNYDGFDKKMKSIMKFPQAEPITDVATMYEVASQVVAMEGVLNAAALIGASVLLFIIMVGVLNSLRMTIRERVQEIGAMRAIGIQRSQVKWLFLWEAFFLAIFGWTAGILVSAVIIKLLMLIQFGVDNPLNMIMVDRRLYFIPTFWHAAQNLILLLVFMLGAAYLPARQAANLSPASAFGHAKG